MRPVANAQVIVADRTESYALDKMMAPEVSYEGNARILWDGELNETDVKQVPIVLASGSPIVQRADVQVNASVPKAKATGVAVAEESAEVVNFVLFVPPDLGRSQSLCRRKSS